MEIIIKKQKDVRDLGILDNTSIDELEIQESDLSNIQILGLESGRTYLAQSKFKSCRFINANFNDAVIKHCNWIRCDLRSINLWEGQIQSCIFDQCKLQNASFHNAKIKKVVLKNCDLTDLDLSGAEIKQLDIRGSTIKNIRIYPKLYNEITVDHSQALYFASLSGLHIK